MKSLIVFHIDLFNQFTGSTEKLLQDIAVLLADSGDFLVWCVYGENGHESDVPKLIREHDRIRLFSFSYSCLATRPPWRPLGLDINLKKLLNTIKPSVFIGVVSSGHQWPLTSIPSDIPLLLISPFGDFCSNGNVRKLYVSGNANVSKLKKKGIDIAEVFFNPLEVPLPRIFFPTVNLQKVIFGRCGRSNSAIFDPISLRAFAKLELEYGDLVKYIYVNPPSEAIDLANVLEIKNVSFTDWLSIEELKDFYLTIDVFAHARRDGETLGVAIGEALLNSCVVVSHKSKFFNEHLFLLQEPFGLVAEIDDVEGYYKHLKWCVENKSALPELGVKARTFAQKLFDKNIIAKKIVKDCLEVSSFTGRPLDFIHRLQHDMMRLRFWIEIIFNKLWLLFLDRLCYLFKFKGN